MSIVVRNQICASDVDWRIMSLHFFQKPDTSDKKVHWKTGKLKACAHRLKQIDKTSEKSTDKSKSQKTYASMERMSTNEESTRSNYEDILQLTNWILDSITTCNMTPELSDFMPVSLVEINNHTSKLQMGIFHIKTNMINPNRNE